MKPGGEEERLTLIFHSSIGMRGFAVSNHRLPGMTPFSSMYMDLMRPARPLAPSRWPMLVLIDPTSNGVFAVLEAPIVDARASASIGSPAGVCKVDFQRLEVEQLAIDTHSGTMSLKIRSVGHI